MSAANYDRDFYEWTQQQAQLLREGRVSEADVDHIAEEIEAMGIRDRRELESRMKVLLQHLLKWQFQLDQRSSGWPGTINEQRDQLDILLRQSPSLHRFVEDAMGYSYPKARRAASLEAELLIGVFPETCPYSKAEVLDADYLPPSSPK